MVAPSQLRALHYLLKNRLDPDTCEYDTAVKVESAEGNKVKANRPIQATSDRHRLVYCECSDWNPKGAKDKAYCELSAKERGVFDGTEGAEPTLEPRTSAERTVGNSTVPSTIPTTMPTNGTQPS